MCDGIADFRESLLVFCEKKQNRSVICMNEKDRF